MKTTTGNTTTEYGTDNAASTGVRVSVPVVEGSTAPVGEAGAVLSPEEYASSFTSALAVEDLGRVRSAQTDGGVLGASDAGQCVHKAVLTVRRTPPTDVPKKGKAQIGTYLHEGTLNAVQALYPHKLVEQELTVTLPSGLQVMLHPDEIDPAEPSVTDYKFTSDVALYRRTGATEAQQMQRNLQYLAALQAGILHADSGIVRNLYVDMTDADNTFVDQAPFDMEWVHRADDWYQTVRYHVVNDEDGSKDWPWHMCKDYCPFFSMCRTADPDLSQPITSEEIAVAVVEGFNAREQRRYWEGVEKAAISRVKGVTGRVDGLQVVTTRVNGPQRQYDRVDFKEIAS